MRNSRTTHIEKGNSREASAPARISYRLQHKEGLITQSESYEKWKNTKRRHTLDERGKPQRLKGQCGQKVRTWSSLEARPRRGLANRHVMSKPKKVANERRNLADGGWGMQTKVETNGRVEYKNGHWQHMRFCDGRTGGDIAAKSTIKNLITPLKGLQANPCEEVSNFVTTEPLHDGDS